MNFASEAIPLLERLARRQADIGHGFDARSLKFMVKCLREGVKFLLPLHGKVGVSTSGVTEEIFELLRCPYPIVIFEYETTDQVIEKFAHRADAVFGRPASNIIGSSKRIVIVIDGESEEYIAKAGGTYKGILVIPISYMDEMSIWMPSPVGVYVPRQNKVIEQELEGRMYSSFDTQTIELLPGILKESVADAGPQVKQDVVRDAQEDLTVAICALTAINCRNVNYVSLPPSIKLNRKRAKSGKEPFYEYRILDIFVPEARALPSGGGRRRQALQAAMRNPSKLGYVRGHFKRRATGVFWWSRHFRGDQRQGVVVKDYRVKTKGDQNG